MLQSPHRNQHQNHVMSFQRKPRTPHTFLTLTQFLRDACFLPTSETRPPSAPEIQRFTTIDPPVKERTLRFKLKHACLNTRLIPQKQCRNSTWRQTQLKSLHYLQRKEIISETLTSGRKGQGRTGRSLWSWGHQPAGPAQSKGPASGLSTRRHTTHSGLLAQSRKHHHKQAREPTRNAARNSLRKCEGTKTGAGSTRFISHVPWTELSASTDDNTRDSVRPHDEQGKPGLARRPQLILGGQRALAAAAAPPLASAAFVDVATVSHSKRRPKTGSPGDRELLPGKGQDGNRRLLTLLRAPVPGRTEKTVFRH